MEEIGIYTKALGYPKSNELTFDKYWGYFIRNGLAKRIVTAPVTHSWRLKPTIEEVDKNSEEESEFEEQWSELIKENSVYHYLVRADKLSGIGRYSVLLLGFNDGAEELKDPVIEGLG